MIFATKVKMSQFTKAELKAAGFDPRTKICPNHPNVISVNGLRDIILVPYRTTKFDKTLGKDVIVAMGLSCGRCGMVIKSDLHAVTGHIAALPTEQKQAKEEPKTRIEPLP